MEESTRASEASAFTLSLIPGVLEYAGLTGSSARPGALWHRSNSVCRNPFAEDKTPERLREEKAHIMGHEGLEKWTLARASTMINGGSLQRELDFDLIGLPAPMRIVTNAYKT